MNKKLLFCIPIISVLGSVLFISISLTDDTRSDTASNNVNKTEQVDSNNKENSQSEDDKKDESESQVQSSSEQQVESIASIDTATKEEYESNNETNSVIQSVPENNYSSVNQVEQVPVPEYEEVIKEENPTPLPEINIGSSTPVEPTLTPLEEMAKQASEYFTSRGMPIDLLTRGGYVFEESCAGLNGILESFKGYPIIYFQTGDFMENWFYYCPELNQGYQVFFDENGFPERGIMY